MSQDNWQDAVIIVGAGLSGGSAALTILQNGGRVILVEKEKKLGGNSVRASSGINAAETIHQKDQGVKDTVELFAQDTAYSKDKDRSAKPTPLIWALAKNSADAVHWIEKNGLHIPVLSQCGGHSAARTHRPLTGAAGGYITLGLLKKVREYESKGTYKEIKQAKMTKLLKGQDGRVNGIEYSNLKDNSTQQLRGACVVITTGGFCFNKQLLKKYAPHIANLPTTNGPWTLGEGMLIAQNIGAKLVDMECIQVHPTGFVDPAKPDDHEKTLAAECLRAAGALLLNEKGRRFVNELGHRDDVTAGEKSQKGPIRLVLNPAAVKEVTPHVNMYKNFFKVLKTYKNAAELAAEMKIPVENILDTFETYNQAARKGWCPSGKDRFPAVPFKGDQELTVGFVVPVLHYVMGGILINEHAQVLSDNDKPISGLFASGETTGGVHGRNRLAGNSLVDCVVYGRIAAASALNYSKQQNKQKSKL